MSDYGKFVLVEEDRKVVLNLLAKRHAELMKEAQSVAQIMRTFEGREESPIIKGADPELERLLAEEEEIESKTGRYSYLREER